MAFLRELGRRRCCRCGSAASVELVIGSHAAMGAFCRPCGCTELERVESAEYRPAIDGALIDRGGLD